MRTHDVRPAEIPLFVPVSFIFPPEYHAKVHALDFKYWLSKKAAYLRLGFSGA